MPKGHYSKQPEQLRPVAITEPDRPWVSPRSQDQPSSMAASSSDYGVQAKEPDRQNTPATGTPATRRRGGVSHPLETEAEPRSRSQRRAQPAANTPARRIGGRTTLGRRGSALPTRRAAPKKSRRGFAAMSPDQQREIARKGGQTVSRNRRHMAEIGRVGGEHSHGGRRARR